MKIPAKMSEVTMAMCATALTYDTITVVPFAHSSLLGQRLSLSYTM